MKKILITGKNSYVGNSFEKWVAQWSEEYEVDKISIRNEDWKDYDFGKYDVVLHVAGIAHQKETVANKHLYYEINRDLAYEVAKKAKKDSVKHFVFLSSMSIYGKYEGTITLDTPLRPNSAYGKSKEEAEKLLTTLIDESFTLAIIRPPMIYGNDCKGNYQLLSKFASQTIVFPSYENQRSMIYIENLNQYIRYVIDFHKEGVHFPQNKEYVNTNELINQISKNLNNKNIFFLRGFNKIISYIKAHLKISVFQKVFGDLVYDKRLSIYPFEEDKSYQYVSFDESIYITERGI